MGDIVWLTTEEVGAKYGLQPLSFEFDKVRSKLVINGAAINRCWLQDDVERLAAGKKANGNRK